MTLSDYFIVIEKVRKKVGIRYMNFGRYSVNIINLFGRDMEMIE